VLGQFDFRKVAFTQSLDHIVIPNSIQLKIGVGWVVFVSFRCGPGGWFCGGSGGAHDRFRGSSLKEIQSCLVIIFLTKLKNNKKKRYNKGKRLAQTKAASLSSALCLSAAGHISTTAVCHMKTLTCHPIESFSDKKFKLSDRPK
jgi:hypothetical protein